MIPLLAKQTSRAPRAGEFFRRLLSLAPWIVGVIFAVGLSAAETLPPAPSDHFNDYARVVSAGVASELDALLVEHERSTSNQILVAIYPRMESSSSVEDYTVRVAQAWKAGAKSRDNGAVLFAFMQERQLYLQVGYGLEGAIPDALAKRIIEDEIVPRFRAGDVDGGFRAGVTAMVAAARGEYVGTGRTVTDAQRTGNASKLSNWAGLFIFITLVVMFRRLARRDVVYTSRGRRSTWFDSGSSGSGRGGFGGGGSGGGGSFSGGGGGFGGGGAGGKW